ncbi:MAG TPA: FecR domain-containing protein [Steroidobacteraceae bacterium]
MLRALAEASAWIVTLHGPDRTEAVERGFRRWLAENPLNSQAFEHATETWVNARARIRRAARLEVDASAQALPRAQYGRRFKWMAAAATLIVVLAGLVFHLRPSAFSTEVGERRQLVLEDGTQVSLNTATRLIVRYSDRERRVELASGEALFDVAPLSSRPFVVSVGQREIRALGTSFLVRRDDEHVAVTLVHGKVAVSEPGADAMDASRSAILAPGERMIFSADGRPRVDRPQIEKLTAWQQGMVNIDDMTLAEAAAEMNRYSPTQIVVEGPAANLRVSGVFRITDAENMARAVAMTHGLQMRHEGRRILLSGTPQPPGEALFDSVP